MKTWTTEQEQFLRDNYKKLSHLQMAAAIGKTSGGTKAKILKMGLTLTKAEAYERRTAYARSANNKRRLTIDEDEFVKKHYLELSIHEIGRQLGRAKSAVKCSMTRQGLFLTDEIRYKRAANNLGKPSCNKGRKQSEYMTPEQIERTVGTRFKKGDSTHNRKPIGSESSIQGYLKVKVAEPRTWKFKHVLIYEQHFGQITEGSIVVFKDGNNRNFDLKNLACITRGEHLRRENIAGRYKISRDNLEDKFVADILKRKTGLQREDIPAELIAMKRAQLNLNRQLKTIKNDHRHAKTGD